MEREQSQHSFRIEQIRASFDAANARLVARLRESSDEAAAAASGGAWSAAQIGWHVAAVTTRFAGIMSGSIPAAQPLAPEFSERAWPEILASIPSQAKAPTATLPPTSVPREEAVTALETSGVLMTSALASLTPERGGRLGITHPIVGTISVYQIGDWATAHVIRHNLQAKRALATAQKGGPAQDA